MSHSSSDQSGRPVPPPYPRYDDEIDLADYFRVIIKWKWLVVVSILVFFGLGVFKSTGQKQAYEARISLLIMPPSYKTELTPPTFSMDVYKELSNAQDLRQSIVDSLGLHDASGKKLNAHSIGGLLKTELLQSTGASQSGPRASIMHLIVTSLDTVLLPPVQIANVWAELFVKKNSGISSQETDGSYIFIKEQYEFVRDNLQRMEDSLLVFNQNNPIEVLKSDLEPINKKLVEYQTDMVNTGLALNDLEEALKSQDKYLLAVETSNGQWIGDLDVWGEGGINRLLIDEDHRRILDTTVHNRDVVRMLQKQVQNFEDEKDMSLIKDDLQLKRNTLLSYISELSRLKVDMFTVSQIIEDLKQNDRSKFDGSDTILEMLPPEALREFGSIHLGYNLLIPRHTYLVQEMVLLKTEIDSLEQVFTDNTRFLALIKEKLVTAEQVYDTLLTQYREKKSQVIESKLAINMLRSKVRYQENERIHLERKVRHLTSIIARAEMERVRLERNVAIYSSNFQKFSSLLENARAAKANQPSDVKIVARAVDIISLPLKSITTILIFVIVGFVGSLLGAFILEYVEKARFK